MRSSSDLSSFTLELHGGLCVCERERGREGDREREEDKERKGKREIEKKSDGV